VEHSSFRQAKPRLRRNLVQFSKSDTENYQDTVPVYENADGTGDLVASKQLTFSFTGRHLYDSIIKRRLFGSSSLRSRSEAGSFQWVWSLLRFERPKFVVFQNLVSDILCTDLIAEEVNDSSTSIDEDFVKRVVDLIALCIIVSRFVEVVFSLERTPSSSRECLFWDRW